MTIPERIVRVRISGRVQGVGFRVFVQSEAEARGLRGWVRNRSNGDVEAVFAGDARAVAALCEACRQGPRAARVAHVEVHDADRSASAEGGNAAGFVQLGTI